MATPAGPTTVVNAAPTTLVDGQHLSQAEFHALYEATSPEVRAELIDGVVSMPSPARLEHGDAQLAVLIWLDYYAESTPGVRAAGSVTTILSPRSEPQPDALLRILAERGGQSHDQHGYLHGAPELVVEVSKATRYVDLGPKLRDYERAGVREYVVRAIDPDEILWFALEHGALVQQSVGVDGLYRSTVFSGLWLDPSALLSGNRHKLRSVVDLGCATPEHAAFVARLAAHSKPSSARRRNQTALNDRALGKPTPKPKDAQKKRQRRS
jgi:Uma2 family endonuclease